MKPAAEEFCVNQRCSQSSFKVYLKWFIYKISSTTGFLNFILPDLLQYELLISGMDWNSIQNILSLVDQTKVEIAIRRYF